MRIWRGCMSRRERWLVQMINSLRMQLIGFEIHSHFAMKFERINPIALVRESEELLYAGSETALADVMESTN